MQIERRLAEVLSEFARTMVTDFSIQEILDHLVMRIVDVLPVSGAGVTLISPGAHPRYVAASGEAALRFEQLQSEVGEGLPGGLPHRRGGGHGGSAERPALPELSPPCPRDGPGRRFAFPLRCGDHRLGALDLFRGSAGVLNAEALAAAQTLADVAAAY